MFLFHMFCAKGPVRVFWHGDESQKNIAPHQLAHESTLESAILTTAELILLFSLSVSHYNSYNIAIID